MNKFDLSVLFLSKALKLKQKPLTKLPVVFNPSPVNAAVPHCVAMLIGR